MGTASRATTGTASRATTARRATTASRATTGTGMGKDGKQHDNGHGKGP